jgi:hypothetical protein
MDSFLCSPSGGIRRRAAVICLIFPFVGDRLGPLADCQLNWERLFGYLTRVITAPAHAISPKNTNIAQHT